MSWFRGKSKEPEPAATGSSFSADASAFEGATNFASGPPPSLGGGGGMADLQVKIRVVLSFVMSSTQVTVWSMCGALPASSCVKSMCCMPGLEVQVSA